MFILSEWKQALTRLPEVLEYVYASDVQMLRNIHDEGLAKARLMITWAAFSERPLTIEEFRDAIAISTDSESTTKSLSLLETRVILVGGYSGFARNITDLTGGLLQIVASDIEGTTRESSMFPSVERTDIVRLSHLAVREFVIESQMAGPFRLNEADGHRIATASQDYLVHSLPMESMRGKDVHFWSSGVFEDFIRYLQDRPLLGYVIRFLPKYKKPESTSPLLDYLRRSANERDSHTWNFLESMCHRVSISGIRTDDETATSARSFMTTCLVTACKIGCPVALKIIFEARTDIKIDVADPISGRTALLWAAENGDRGAVQLLLNKGANIEVTGRNGETALHCASKKGHKGVTQLLLDSGADFRKMDNDEWTALHRARQNGHREVVRVLTDAHNGALNLAIPPLTDDINDRFNASIVDFSFLDNEIEIFHRRPSVKECISDPSSLGEMTRGNLGNQPPFRWLHFPANNVSNHN
jgi:hypothetical protein